MNFIEHWFTENLDVVFFIYGLAFLVMGIFILAQPKKFSEYKIANIFWILAAFGLTHGANELLDMWAIIKGRNTGLDIIRWFVLLISYFFLFEFGRQFFLLIMSTAQAPLQRIAKLFVWWLSPLIGIFILKAGFDSHDFWRIGSIWTRYLLGLPGGLLIGASFIRYYKSGKEIFRPLLLEKYFLIAGVAFISYGVLGGLVVPRADFFPSSWLNTDSFLSTVRIPVQVFRSVCAIAITWGVYGILKIFNFELLNKLLEARVILSDQLKESEKRYMEIVEDSSDLIHTIDAHGYIVCSNRQGYELLGYSSEELIGKHLREIYAPEMWSEFKDGFERLRREGAFFIDNGGIVKKDDKMLRVVLYALGLYDQKRDFIGARLTARDITDRIKLENELRARVKELEDFYYIAIERELKMRELKEEIIELKERLKGYKL